METTGTAKSALKPRIPVCVRFIPVDFPPPWPPMMAIAPAGPAAFKKSPNIAKRFISFWLGLPFVITSTIFPLSRETCLISFSMSNKLTVTTSPSAPPAGVEPVQPIASTCILWRTGERISPSAVPRVQPRQMVYFSVCTFSRPMDFIFAAPHSSALRSAGVPVTRPPMSSLNSVRNPMAWEFIIPSPAMRVIPCSADAATAAHDRLYRPGCSFYTALVIERRLSRKPPALLLCTATACFLFTTGWHARSAQEAQPRPAVEPAAKPTEKETAAHPAQIELLETNVRFEVNGDSRKEVHALVKINSELGVRQFAQLNFDFNRSFESVEIPMVHITHANGGTSDILPSAVTDHPNPAVVNAPAYQDVRVKSVRILGLEPGDTLEYRVVRSVAHDPRAPGGLSFEHTFDHVGVVTREDFELNMPAEILEDRPHGPGPSFPPDPSGALPPNLAVLGLPYPHPGQIYI